ncbi:MAG: hypothetical protein HY023_08065 [Chloroflexi bacterium]|nr:hypothetical protein [Chloroflexota bacterium]
MQDETRPLWLGATAAIALTLCLSLCAILVAAQMWLPSSKLPSRAIAKTCMSLRLTGGFRLATWWAPLSVGRSGRPGKPFIQSNMACGYMPWAPVLPAIGNLETSD